MEIQLECLIVRKLCINAFSGGRDNLRAVFCSSLIYSVRFLFFLCLLFQPNAINAQEKNTDNQDIPKAEAIQPTPSENENKDSDRDFLSKKSAILEDFKKQKKALDLQAKSLEAENKDIQKELESLSSTLLVRAATLLFLNLTNLLPDLVLWFFPILVLNHFLYLLIRKRDFFIRHRTLVIAAFAVFEICFFLPLICSAQETENTLIQKKPTDPFIVNLQEVDRLIKMTPTERNIYILEHTGEESVILENVEVQSTFLVPCEGSIEIKSPDYYFTLAALYRHFGKEEMVTQNLEDLDQLPLELRWLKQYASIYPKVLNEYLSKNRLVEGTEVVRRLIAVYGEQKDVDSLIELSAFLIEKEMNASAEEALKEACNVAQNINQVIFVAEYLLKNHRNSELGLIIKQAIDRTGNLDDVMTLLRFCIENGLKEETSRAINQAMKTSESVEDDLALASFLFEKGRKQESAKILDQAREKTTRLLVLLAIANVARNQGFLSSAIKCIERAILVDTEEALNYELPPPDLLDTSKFLPSQQPISLPTYLGILQQLERKLEKASLFYKFSLMQDLGAIIQSYGYRIAGNINEFYYLKQLWMQTHSENMKFLLPIYAHLQENLLKKERLEDKTEIDVLSEKVEQLKKQKIELLEARDKAESRLFNISIAISLHALRGLAIFLVIGTIITGCTIKGVHSAKLATNFKFFAFFWKFLESIGWSASFSVVGIPFGIPLVPYSEHQTSVIRVP